MILCLFVFCAGQIDAAVGGGSLIQIPALSPLPSAPSVTLLGTNKVASACGTSFATLSFIGRASIPWGLVLPATFSAFAMAFFSSAGKALYATATPMAVSNMLGAVTGTMAFGFMARNSGVSVERNPRPHYPYS